jgi:diaminohydroxyphosphoribosylaminopyrimidine deaminase/5-amino-6-(5-phosphoribosylamino)uracil reductase
VKQAINRDGNMLPPAGQKTFTSQSSLKLAHSLRRRADAILTGSGTILADAPHFTVRHLEDITHKRRKLVLFDRRQRISKAYLEAATARGFEIIFARELEPALRALASEGALEVLVEAGPQLTASVLASPFWDEHVLITQSAEPGGQDTVEIKHNNMTAEKLAKEVKHVLRHH